MSIILIAMTNVFCYSCSPRSEELIVATKDGWLHRLNWDGIVDNNLAINIRSVRFSADLETTTGRYSVRLCRNLN